MARAFQVMQSGVPAAAAVAGNGGNAINTAVLAAGTTQGTATAISAAINYISTAAANSGVILPQGQPGDEIEIFNGGVGACYVYPPTSARINALSLNAGAVLAPNTSCKYRQLTTALFIANMSA